MRMYSDMRTLFPLILAVLLFSHCDPDRGEQLFEIVYEPIDFTLSPGQPSFQSLVVARPAINTRLAATLQSSNVSLEQLDEISGLFARVVSLSGEDFGEFRSIDLRLCPVGQTGGCTEFDLLFSVDDLFRRRDNVINLNPGLRNFRDLYDSEQVRLEIVFLAGQTTTQSIDCRLEWSIRGVSR